MTLHLIKLSVGTEDLADLERWQKQRLRKTGRLYHRTRMRPRRSDELLDGGSIYWVIKRQILARQRLSGIEPVLDEEGIPRTLLMLDPRLVPVLPRPHRAFQGWRYLSAKDAPVDLADAPEGAAEMPAELVAELRGLGLL